MTAPENARARKAAEELADKYDVGTIDRRGGYGDWEFRVADSSDLTAIIQRAIEDETATLRERHAATVCDLCRAGDMPERRAGNKYARWWHSRDDDEDESCLADQLRESDRAEAR